MAKKIRENRKKTSLAEGFLDGEEDVNVTPEDAQPEVHEDDAVEGEEELTDEPADAEERDISDDPSEDDEPAESEDDDDLDDTDEAGEDDGVTKDEGERQEDLQDTMQSLITAVQALTDQINKQKTSDDNAAENNNAEEDTPVEDDEITDDSADEESEGEETADDDSDAEYEGDDTDETSDAVEETSDEETDETKSEAWNHYVKFGKLLHEKSGSLIGMLQHNRFDALEPCIMAVVESKIHDRVEGAKKEFRMEAYNRKFGEQ